MNYQLPYFNKGKSNEVPPKTIKGKSPNSKKDKGDVQIRSGIRKRKESNVRTVTPPLESSTSANDDVVFVSYEKFLESSHVDSKSVTNDLTAAVHAETKNSSQIINAHTSKTKKEHKLASIFIEAKSQELCTLNSKRNINEFFKSNQACKTEKSLHCNSLPKKVLTKKKLRRKQAVVRRYADDDCTSVRRLRSTHHLESTTECRVGAQDDECANTNTSVTNTAKKLKCNRRSSGRNVLPNPEVRRSSRLQDACKRMLTDSCVEQKVRTKINKHLEVQKNGPGSLSSYKVAFITSRKSNNGIKIRLTRLCNQNDKPAVSCQSRFLFFLCFLLFGFFITMLLQITVQKASRLLKRAKLGSAIGTKPVSFIPSSRKPQVPVKEVIF